MVTSSIGEAREDFCFTCRLPVDNGPEIAATWRSLEVSVSWRYYSETSEDGSEEPAGEEEPGTVDRFQFTTSGPHYRRP